MSNRNEYFSVKITRIALTIAGFWQAKTKKQKRMMKFCRFFSFQAIIGAILTQTMEFTISTGSLTDIVYWLCSAMPTTLVTIKFSLIWYRRHELDDLLHYTKKHIWLKSYNEDHEKIMKASDKEATYSIILFFLVIYASIASYIIAPIIENIGQPEEDRKFPFNGLSEYLDPEAKKSPKFEINFFIEVLPMFHIGLLICCFDCLLFLLTAFLTGQFKILQHRLKNICSSFNLDSEDNRQEISDKLKELVEYHKSLTIYVSQMEQIFTIYLFCQLLTSAILICVAGIIAFLVKTTVIKGFLFKFHMMGTLFQTLLTTRNGNNIITESNDVGFSAYEMLWYNVPYDKYGKTIRQAVKTIIMRSHRPCYLTAGGFFPVSLVSFMSVISTTVSYFTLIRQFL